jgi:hypothetical protein
LLSQQMPQASSALDRPGPLRPRRRPRDKFPAWAAEARTRSSPSGSSAGPITTAVCELLCGSTPIITAVISTLQAVVTRNGRTWRACLITDLLSLAPLSSHATERSGRPAPRYKARPCQCWHSRQADREPARRTSRTLRHNRSALRHN